MAMKSLKENLFLACTSFVDQKLATIQKIISSNQNALQSETKSSAGDKHETGRAMLQLEMEKASQQFNVVSEMNDVLKKIELQPKHDIVKLGSLITTNHGNYFLTISIGAVSIEQKEYFILSPTQL